MANKSIVQIMRDKKMDRKEFLKYSGFIFLGFIGFKTIISLLDQPNEKLTIIESRKESEHGFGSGKYGA